MRTAHSAQEKPKQDPESFYRELTLRNIHFVSPAVQGRLKDLKVVVAGCGAAGGACTTSLARLGMTHFRLADNGDYELNNLNRQHAYVGDVGRNKAEFHASEILAINPFADVQAFPEGVTPLNVRDLVSWADVVIDAVDVTTQSGMLMKVALHEAACVEGKPVYCPIDPGFAQWGITYDYRRPRSRPLNGRAEACKKAQHPIKALFSVFPLSSIPAHAFPLLIDLLTRKGVPASQMGCSADLLSAVIAACMIRFAGTDEVVRGWDYTVASLALSRRERLALWLRAWPARARVRKLLRQLP